MKQFRHGDVFLEQVANPSRQGRRYQQDNVLAEGEATGHAHRVTGDFLLYDLDGTLYLRTKGSATLVHEEHAQIALPRGTFKVTLQREWSPEGWTRVLD